jgi:hypothetical protein
MNIGVLHCAYTNVVLLVQPSPFVHGCDAHTATIPENYLKYSDFDASHPADHAPPHTTHPISSARQFIPAQTHFRRDILHRASRKRYSPRDKSACKR